MLSKEYFIKIIQNELECDENLSKLDALGINLYETPLHDHYWTLFDLILEIYFTKTGQDFILDFILENKPIIIHLDDNEDGEVLTINTAEELYDFMLNNKTTFFND